MTIASCLAHLILVPSMYSRWRIPRECPLHKIKLIRSLLWMRLDNQFKSQAAGFNFQYQKLVMTLYMLKNPHYYSIILHLFKEAIQLPLTISITIYTHSHRRESSLNLRWTQIRKPLNLHRKSIQMNSKIEQKQ